MAGEEKTSHLNVPHLNITKYCLTADYYANLCPSVSRFCMTKVQQIKSSEGVVSTPAHVCCQYCNSVYRPGNYTVKIVPKMRESVKIQKLKRKLSTKGEQSLGKYQKKLIQNFTNSRTKVVMTCSCCKKKTVIPCPQKPEKIVALHEEEAADCGKPKQSKKKMKQKRRRKAKLEEEDTYLTDKPSTSSSTKVTFTKSAVISTPSSKSGPNRISTTGSSSIPTTVQRPLQTDNKLQLSKSKKKPKDVHKTLQRMLQKERHQETTSKSSLQSFLSSL